MKYNFAYLDEDTKKEIRRKILKAVAIPGHQIPFGSRVMPLAKGFGTGGLQITLSILKKNDIIKVIDQGRDDSLNPTNIKRLIKKTAPSVKITDNTTDATVIQTRHRIPEERLKKHQILVLQCPFPEPLRWVEKSEAKTRKMHAEMDYSKAYLYLYEHLLRYGEVLIGTRYPVMVNNRYLMDPTPIPRWDIPKLNYAECLFLFGAGREKRIYAVPPYTKVEPLEFEDHKFRTEDMSGKRCELCGSENVYLDEVIKEDQKYYVCSDSNFCEKMRKGIKVERWEDVVRS